MRTRIICLVLVVMLAFVVFSSCTPVDFYPNDGDWYCEELKIQVNFGGEGECFVLIDGEKVKCGWLNDRGSDSLSVICQESECDYCRLGEDILWAKFVSLDENTLVVKDANSGVEYTFVRIN